MGISRESLTRLATLALCVGLVGVGLAAATSSYPAAEPLEARRARLEAMPDDERDRLMRNQQRFEQMPEAQQEELRALHAALEQDPQSEQLKRVMRRYQEWLKTLPTSRRAELQQLPIDERVERIKSWQAEARREQSRHLEPSDIKTYLEWIEKRVVSTLTDKEKKALEAAGNDWHRRAMIRLHLEDPRGRLKLRPTIEEFRELKRNLSPAAQAALTEAQTEGNDAVRRLLYSWMVQARRGLEESRMPNVNKEELTRYFDSLSDRDRDDYLALPPDEMWRRLEWRYLREHYGNRRQDFPPGSQRSLRRSDPAGPERGRRPPAAKPAAPDAKRRFPPNI